MAERAHACRAVIIAAFSGFAMSALVASMVAMPPDAANAAQGSIASAIAVQTVNARYEAGGREGPVLSGYGGPGSGAQAIIGTAFFGSSHGSGGSGGGSAGGSGDGTRTGAASGAGGGVGAVASNTHSSTASARSGHAAPGGHNGRSGRSGTGSADSATGATAGVAGSSVNLTGTQAAAVGPAISGMDLLAACLVVLAIVALGFLTRRLARRAAP